MKNIKVLLIVALACGLYHIDVARAQDARNTQSLGSPLRMNPAMMGANTDMRIILGYRTQWNSIEKGYSTMSFTAMHPFFINSGKSKLDLGVSVYNEQVGAFQTLDASLALGYNLQITDNNNLSVSLMGGYIQHTLDINSLSFDSQYILGSYDASNPSNELSLRNKSGVADASFGVMWFTNAPRDKSKLNAYAGVSGYHMNQPNESLLDGTSQMPMKLSFQGGVKVYGKNKIDISPNARLTVQNGNSEIAVGLYADYVFSDNAKMVIGAWYRRNDAIAFVAGFDHKSFTIGYSYDLVTTPLIQSISGLMAHEITLSYKLSQIKRSKISSFDAGSSSVSITPFASF
jgi:type IX secretion system PorP/SprF family membrane protein